MRDRDNELFFDSPIEARDGYIVKFSPPIGDNAFAAIYLTFENSTQEADSLIKSEAIHWLERYMFP